VFGTSNGGAKLNYFFICANKSFLIFHCFIIKRKLIAELVLHFLCKTTQKEMVTKTKSNG
jgi:hypothetical protein